MSCERRWERWRVKFLVSSKDSTGPPRLFPYNSLVVMQGPTLHCSHNVRYQNILSISGCAYGRSCTRLDGNKHFRGSLCAALTCESQSCSSFVVLHNCRLQNLAPHWLPLSILGGGILLCRCSSTESAEFKLWVGAWNGSGFEDMDVARWYDNGSII